MSAPVTAYRKAWLKWKALRLPWRKRFLAGLDLDGNTYWEFRDTLSPGRMRRIVEYPATVHYSDVSGHITPAWHQWLRHTRRAPPSLAEQAQDLVRLRHIKILAAQADARWNAKASYLDAPSMAAATPALSSSEASLEKVARLGRDAHAERGGAWARTAAETAAGGATGEAGPLDRHVRGEAGGQRPTNPAVAKESAQERKEPRIPVKDDPWKKARGGISEEWQPQAWSPGAAKPRP